MTEISGIWLPVITPFVDGTVDLSGYERLLEHYLSRGVTGIFPLGTTGESPTLDEDEMEALVERTVRVVADRVPVFVGVGGNATAKVLKTLARLERYPFAGIVSVCPYYNRPGQDGLRAHFTRIAEATSREILIYNIPYRTSVNLANDTLLRLAELPNIVGVKDSSGNLAQSLELLRHRPRGFAVMTGDDPMLYTIPSDSSRCTSACGRTIIAPRAPSGPDSRPWSHSSSRRPTRCPSSTACGGRA